LEGLELNGKKINPQSEWEESQSYGFGGSLGTGGFTVSASMDDFSIFGGLSWTGAPTVGTGYQDWFVSGSVGGGKFVPSVGKLTVWKPWIEDWRREGYPQNRHYGIGL
jgi:hypothetical protein